MHVDSPRAPPPYRRTPDPPSACVSLDLDNEAGAPPQAPPETRGAQRTPKGGDPDFRLYHIGVPLFTWLLAGVFITCLILTQSPNGARTTVGSERGTCIVVGPADIAHVGGSYYARVPVRRSKPQDSCGEDAEQPCFLQVPRDLDPRIFRWTRARAEREASQIADTFACVREFRREGQVFLAAPSSGWNACMAAVVLCPILLLNLLVALLVFDEEQGVPPLGGSDVVMAKVTVGGLALPLMILLCAWRLAELAWSPLLRALAAVARQCRATGRFAAGVVAGMAASCWRQWRGCWHSFWHCHV